MASNKGIATRNCNKAVFCFSLRSLCMLFTFCLPCDVHHKISYKTNHLVDNSQSWFSLFSLYRVHIFFVYSLT
jgi:hypothetical protein